MASNEITMIIKVQSEMKKQMEENTKAVEKMQKQTEKSAQKMESSFKGVSNALKTVFSVAAMKAAINYTKAAQKTSLSLEILKIKSKDVYEQLLNTSDATLGLANKYDMVTAANKALAFGIDLSGGKFEALMKMTTKLSAVMGISAAQAFDDLSTATGRQSRMIADNLGVIVKMGDLYKKEAEALGITTKQLTAQQRQRAFLTEIIKQGQKSTASVTDQMIKDNTRLIKSYKLIETVVKDYGQVYTEIASNTLDYWTKQIEDATGYTKVMDRVNARMEAYAAWNQVLIGELDWITKVSGIEEQRNQLLASNIAYKKKLDNEETFEKYVAKLKRKAREREVKAEKAKNKKIYEDRLRTFTSKRDNILDEIIEQEKEIDGYHDLTRIERMKKDEEYAVFKKNNSAKMNTDQREAALEALNLMRTQNARALDESDAFDQKAEALAEKAENRYQNRLKMMGALGELGNSIYQKIYDEAEKKQKEERKRTEAHFNMMKRFGSEYLNAIITGNADAIPQILAQQAMMFGQELIWDGIKTLWMGTAKNAIFPGMGSSAVAVGLGEIAAGTAMAAAGGLANNALSASSSAGDGGANERNTTASDSQNYNINVVTSLYGSKTQAKRELNATMN